MKVLRCKIKHLELENKKMKEENNYVEISYL